MKKTLLTVLGVIVVLIVVLTIVNARQQRALVVRGLNLFSGCPQGVDAKATEAKGEFVCKGKPDPAPFDGNGRACGSCHVPGDRFGISVDRIAGLPQDHPFLFDGIDEDPKLIRNHGLIHVVDEDEDGINEFRPTPKLVHIQKICDKDGLCLTLGLLGDREKDLCQFSREAVANHLTKTVEREEGKDFRLPTDEECKALIAYMRSNLVAGRR